MGLGTKRFWNVFVILLVADFFAGFFLVLAGIRQRAALAYPYTNAVYETTIPLHAANPWMNAVGGGLGVATAPVALPSLIIARKIARLFPCEGMDCGASGGVMKITRFLYPADYGTPGLETARWVVDLFAALLSFIIALVVSRKKPVLTQP